MSSTQQAYSEADRRVWVTTKLQRGEPVDVPFMAREITGSLIDMVLEQEEKHQGPLLAQIMGCLSGDISNGAVSFSRDGATINSNQMGLPSAKISRFRGHPRISKMGPKA